MPRNICQMAIKKRIMTAKVIGYMKPDIDPNTRLYVPFNEGVGDLAKDYSQYCNHAVLTDVEWSPDGFNGAGKFNGSSSYGACGNDASLNIIGALTMVVWVNVNGLDEGGYVISKTDYASAGGYGLYWTGLSDELAFYYGSSLIINSNPVFTESGELVYCVITVDVGNNLIFYKNGIASGADSASITSNSFNVILGNRTGGITEGTHYNGTIDNVIVSSTARSAAQIAADCYEVVCS